MYLFLIKIIFSWNWTYKPLKGLSDLFPNHFSGNSLKIKNLLFFKIHGFSFYSFSLFTFHLRFHITCTQIVLCNELIPSKNVLVQNYKHYKNVWNMFQVNVNVCWFCFPFAWKLHKAREPMTKKKHLEKCSIQTL